MTALQINVLFEDNHLLCVDKPGLLVQGDRTGDVTALDLGKQYIKQKYDKPGNVYLGLVHRIDRPVSGVVVFARTSKAASRLAKEFHDRRVEKKYLAVVVGHLQRDGATIESYVERVHNRSRVADGPSDRAKKAILSFKVLERNRGLTLLEATPLTGRHHQIRLQLAGEGYPVVGDLKYGAREALADKTVSLHSACLSFRHPVKDDLVAVRSAPPAKYPWKRFQSTIEDYFG